MWFCFNLNVFFSVKLIFLQGPFCWPILGNIPFISKHLKALKFHHLVWQRFSEIYGPLVGLKLITDHVVIVSGKTLIRKLYNCEDLNGRPDGFFFRIRSFDKRLGVVFTDGEFWEQQRQFSVKTLKTLGLGKLSMVEHIEREASELVKSFERRSKTDSEIFIQSEGNNIFDISVMNVMWTILRGKRYELDDQRLISIMEAIHKSFQVVDMSGGVLSQLPWLRFIAPAKTGFKPLIDTLKPLWEFLRTNIEEVTQSFDPQDDPRNFIEFYCREISKQKSEKSFFTGDQLLALCVDFFQAGSETTSNTLSFGLLYMLHYPDVLHKVQEELNNVVTQDKLPRLSDRPNLKYTEATINEIMRISSVAPLGIAHRAMNSIEVEGYVIPKNAIVLFNLYSMHVDENCWIDPLEFNPDRFLDCNGELTTNESFVPFGI